MTRGARADLRLGKQLATKSRRLSFLSWPDRENYTFPIGAFEMKLYPKIAVLLILLLCVSPLCVGQVPRDCDQLRSKIERLEIMDVRGMSNSIQQIYSETLAKLYAQLIPCLEQEIAVTAEMSNAVAGTDAANAVQDKLQALKKEKADTESKLTVVRTALNLRETGAQPGGNGLQPNSISRGNGDAVSSVIAAPARAQHS